MAIVRRPAKPSADRKTPLLREPRMEELSAKAASAEAAAAPRPNPADLADEDKSVAAMPVQIFEAAAGQIEDFRETAREMSLQTLESARAAYDRTRQSAEEAVASVEKVFTRSGDAVRKLQIKAIDAMQANTLAMFDLTRGIVACSTFSDALAFSSEHCRKEFEAAAIRSRELAELAQSLTQETVAPLGQTLTDAFGIRA